MHEVAKYSTCHYFLAESALFSKAVHFTVEDMSFFNLQDHVCQQASTNRPLLSSKNLHFQNEATIWDKSS